MLSRDHPFHMLSKVPRAAAASVALCASPSPPLAQGGSVSAGLNSTGPPGLTSVRQTQGSSGSWQLLGDSWVVQCCPHRVPPPCDTFPPVSFGGGAWGPSPHAGTQAHTGPPFTCFCLQASSTLLSQTPSPSMGGEGPVGLEILVERMTRGTWLLISEAPHCLQRGHCGPGSVHSGMEGAPGDLFQRLDTGWEEPPPRVARSTTPRAAGPR